MILLVIMLLLFIIIVLIWLAGFLLATDFSVPARDAKRLKHILVIFPHADDETITCGGFLHRVAATGNTVTLLLLTRGEKGTADATINFDLKQIRSREAKIAAHILGVRKLMLKDFGDGTLPARKPALTAYLAEVIAQEKPDLLITYDRAGFYGHPDHIACSEVITALQQARFPELSLWYVTFPRRVLAIIARPPAGMETSQQLRAYPTHKFWIGASVFAKIRACYTYRSQLASFTKGALPLWFFLSMALFEYFAEVS